MLNKYSTMLLCAMNVLSSLSLAEETTSDRCYLARIAKRGSVYTILSIEEKPGRITYSKENLYARNDYGVLLSDTGERLAYFPIGGLDIVSCESRMIDGKLGGGCVVKDSGGIKLLIPKLANGAKVEIMKGQASVLSAKLP